ncbi:leucine-rich repeat extensin-like protein 3 [Iris pallida]|uniref:Leucine-rich repeat extensin-like protein 3 n=1 Tax=Iris pallida TaxID=29817 RepID=A0AAX6E6P6_IRIPA|nr:leucine-rich repeat extensin-like protein 3 [Iris pallida]
MVMVILVVAMMTLWLERRCGVGSGVDDGAVTTGFGCSMVGKRRGLVGLVMLICRAERDEVEVHLCGILFSDEKINEMLYIWKG